MPGRSLIECLAVVALMSATWAAIAQAPPVSVAVGTELVFNSDFEQENLTGWTLWVEEDGDGCIERDVSGPEASVGPHALRLTVREPGEGCGVVHEASPGIGVESGRWYDLTFQARTSQRENNRGYALTVSLIGREDGIVCARSTIPEVGGDWAGYQLALYAHHSHPDGHLIITVSEPGTLWLDDVSLRARSFVRNP